MELSDLLARLLEFLRLKKTDAAKHDEMERKLRAAKASNVDRLEGLKEQIAILERQARAKKKEYDAATGDTKRIVAGEIERIFGDLDRLKGRETIIGRNIDKVGMAIAKLGELKDARAQGVDEDMLDGLAVELEDIFAELKATDRTADGLDQVRYESPKSKQTDVEARMAELEGRTEPPDGMSQSTLDRLKQLDAEE